MELPPQKLQCSRHIKHARAVCIAPPPSPSPAHATLRCMLIFISALTAGAEEQPPRVNAGLISQVRTLLIDVEYNYITRYAYPPPHLPPPTTY